jgi:LmbE family N-acetylglucosaminyl deacetylase
MYLGFHFFLGFFFVAVVGAIVLIRFRRYKHHQSDFCYDYSWENTEFECYEVALRNGCWQLDAVPKRRATYILSLEVQSNLFGYLFDPRITVECQAVKTSHCLIRGSRGRVGLNITRHFHVDTAPVAFRIQFKNCKSRFKGKKLKIYVGKEIEFNKVMILAPHPDDAEIGSCGLYLSHPSWIITITDGAMGRQYPPWADTQIVARIRIADSLYIPRVIAPPCAAIQSYNLAYPDTKLFTICETETDRWNRLVGEIRQHIEAHQPDIIVTPHPQLDSHPDHVATTSALKKALQSSRHQPRFLFFTLIHNHVTEMYPLGDLRDEIDLPPLPRDRAHQAPLFTDIYTHILDPDHLRLKANALELHSDLRDRAFGHQISFRHWLMLTRRFLLSRIDGMRYNPTDLFERFVRPIEMFLVHTTGRFLAQPDV